MHFDTISPKSCFGDNTSFFQHYFAVNEDNKGAKVFPSHSYFFVDPEKTFMLVLSWQQLHIFWWLNLSISDGLKRVMNILRQNLNFHWRKYWVKIKGISVSWHVFTSDIREDLQCYVLLLRLRFPHWNHNCYWRKQLRVDFLRIPGFCGYVSLHLGLDYDFKVENVIVKVKLSVAKPPYLSIDLHLFIHSFPIMLLAFRGYTSVAIFKKHISQSE